MEASLTPFQRRLALSALPSGATILRARAMQAMAPCPIRIDTDRGSIILRVSRNRGGVEREAAVFPALRELGLPVPETLAGPETDPDRPDLFAMAVNGLLPGRPLDALHPSVAIRFAREAISRLHRAEPKLDLPRRTLSDDLEAVDEGRWREIAAYRRAVESLRPRVAAIHVRLAFTNGDLQPANFLSDGEALTGMVDFEKAAFLDPLSVLAHYPVYGLPFARSGLVEAVVADEGMTMADFDLRVALFALRTLKTKVSPKDGPPEEAALRERLLDLVAKCLGERQA